MSPRAWLFIALALSAVAEFWVIQTAGWNRAWRLWHLDARRPHFSDLRVVTGAGDSLDQGFNPREENPGAPFKQRFNYPGVWLHLRHLGVRNADTTAVGLVLLAGYAVGLWWLAAGIGRGAAVLVGLAVLSPAALLAIERGSTDLAVFACLACAAHVVARAPRGAFAAVLAGFGLKLFPLAGMIVFLREPRTRALRFGLLALGFAALFCALNFRELVDIVDKTEKGPHVSYGWAVLPLHVKENGGAAWARPLYYGALALALLGLGAASWTGWRAAPVEAAGRSLDFFRVGAAVYAGTFLLGANWDYRLIFALFLVPQLAAWAGGGDAVLRRWARGLLAALFVALWSRVLADWTEPFPAPAIAARGLEETAKGFLFLGCVHLLTRTLPAWLKPGSPAALSHS